MLPQLQCLSASVLLHWAQLTDQPPDFAFLRCHPFLSLSQPAGMSAQSQPTFSARLSPYLLLGLPSTASKEQVKEAFRKLCLAHHPGAGAAASTMQEGRARTSSRCVAVPPQMTGFALQIKLLLKTRPLQSLASRL